MQCDYFSHNMPTDKDKVLVKIINTFERYL